MAVSLHEQAHKWITEHSIGGLWMVVFARLMENDKGNSQGEFLECAAENLAGIVGEVQEGFASYIEYLRLKSEQSTTLDNFKEMLKGSGPEYSNGFNAAANIESIITGPNFSNLSEEHIDYLRRFLLLDIARFSLNVPFTSEEIEGKFTELTEDRVPNYRWRGVMVGLTEDSEAREKFLSFVSGQAELWINKMENQFQNGQYAGNTYKDDCQEVLAESFSHFPFSRPEDDEQIKRVVRFDTGKRSGGKTETSRNYLLRTCESELLFEPAALISNLGESDGEELLRSISVLSKDEDADCYLRILSGGSAAKVRRVCRGAGGEFIDVPYGYALALLHEAKCNRNEDGTVFRIYNEGGVYFLFADEMLKTVLQKCGVDTVNLVLDFEYFLDGRFYEIIEWLDPEIPVYLVPNQHGSLGSVVDLLENSALRNGADIFFTGNWTNYHNRGSDQVGMMWALPHGFGGRVSVLSFLTEETLGALSVWQKEVGFPAGLNVITITDEFEAEPGRQKWLIDIEGGKIFAPQNASVVTPHILSLYW